MLAPFLLWLYLFGSAAIVAMAWQTTTSTGTAGAGKKPTQRDFDLSSSILQSLKKRSKPGPSPVLDLVHDFYDPSTGLHSEGVWHNGMAGIASLRLQHDNDNNNDEYYGAAAQRIADSLWKYSWDGTSFQRRAYSGLWDHTPLLSNDNANANAATPSSIHQSNYYQPSKEHRCVQHGLASIFWSDLVVDTNTSMPSSSSSSSNNKSTTTTVQEDQSKRIAESFVDQFWDDTVGKWHTVSKQQGWGTVLRPSASSGQPTMGLTTGEERYYFRAVDQAIGILACLGMLKQQQHHQHATTNNNTRKIQGILEQTCKSLLLATNEDGFGFDAAEDDARSYIGLERNRNFWHDGWTLLALTLAREYAWPSSNDDDDDDDSSSSGSSVGQEELGRIFQRLVDRYGHLKVVDDKDGSSSTTSSSSYWDGTVWHWERSFKPDVASGNVRYCGDNALMYAIARNLNDCIIPQPQSMDTVDSAFHSFIQELRSRDPVNGLSSVADAYPQIRLHPNTELAALALW